jgi:ATP-dependent 26S proteasome regulatory subunit
MTDPQRIQQLIVAQHGCIAIATHEEPHMLAMLRQIATDRGSELWVWSVTLGWRDGLTAHSPPITETDHPAAAMYYIANLPPKARLYVTLDLAGHLKDERTLRAMREALHKIEAFGANLIMLDATEELPPAVKAIATRFEPAFPDERELEALIRQTVRRLKDDRSVDVSLTKQDLDAVVRNLAGLDRRQAKQVILDVICDDCRFDSTDIPRILAQKRRAVGSGPLDYVEAPVSLEEIGGLRKLKAWLNARQNCLTDQAAEFGLPTPRGVLMLGVQGAGKSLSAKAVATAWQRPLLRLDAGNLYDRYIGESEKRLRDALHQAERMAPVVVWIDEIEKGFASAASHSSDGGLSKRMFGTLLTWMQEHTAPVFLVATANDIAALPPELLRKGRFDEIFFVDLPTLEARHAILAVHLKKRKREPKNFDLDTLAEASAGYSGAEIEQAIISALHDAYAAKKELTTDYVLASIKGSPPLSVTMAERIAELRQWAEGRCVPAD